MSAKSEDMIKLIGLEPVENRIDYEVLEIFQCNGYRRELIQYFIHGRKNIAFLLLPDGEGKHPAVLINHQHNRERNLGKSEVCGLAGNPLQAFGPALAERGFVVIAPDSLCFEDRRVNASGIDKNDEDDDWQHFITMCYGILTGNTLAKTVIEDAMDIYIKAEKEYKKYNAGQQISIKEYEGGHALTLERFNYIVDWISEAIK